MESSSSVLDLEGFFRLRRNPGEVRDDSLSQFHRQDRHGKLYRACVDPLQPVHRYRAEIGAHSRFRNTPHIECIHDVCATCRIEAAAGGKWAKEPHWCERGFPATFGGFDTSPFDARGAGCPIASASDLGISVGRSFISRSGSSTVRLGAGISQTNSIPD